VTDFTQGGRTDLSSEGSGLGPNRTGWAHGAEIGTVVLAVGPGGGNGPLIKLNVWKQYSFNSNFLTPTDGWSFTVGDEVLSSHATVGENGEKSFGGDSLRIALAPRQLVFLSIGGHIQCTGIIDKVTTTTTRSGGTEVTIEGRDLLSPAVDSVIDPRVVIKPEMKLLDMLTIVLGPFGFPRRDQYLISNEDNRNIMSGKKHATSKNGVINNGKGKADKPKKFAGLTAAHRNFGFSYNPTQAEKQANATEAKRAADAAAAVKTKKAKGLDEYQLHLLKPEQHEGALQFAERVCKRLGLTLWLHADGRHIVVAKPKFDQAPVYTLVHRKPPEPSLDDNQRITNEPPGTGNDILSATVVRDAGSQPSIIFASGAGSGGANPRSQFTVCVVNPVIQGPDLSAIFKAYPNTKPLDLAFLGPNYSGNGKDTDIRISNGSAYVDTWARPLFLHDENSKTVEELESFLKRELATRMHKAFTYTVEVVGHEFEDSDGKRTPWVIDTIVRIEDDVCDVHEDLWILDRTFTKSRSGGTKTKLICVRPHTLEF
jgi:prophage tail gpP-like protein